MLSDAGREPLEVLHRARRARQRDDPVRDQNGPEPPEGPPQGDPRTGRLARQAVNQEGPFVGGVATSCNHGYIVVDEWRRLITTESLIAYVALAAALTVTPGPNMALVIRTALDSGPSGGLLATLGVVTGLTMWAFASALGVAAVLQTVPHGFTVLQGAGGVWLIFLGLRALRSSAPSELTLGTRTTMRHSYSAGLVTNLLNPMVGAFYLAALPGFVPPGPMAPMTSLVLAAVHIAMVFMWLSATSVLIARGTVLLERPEVRQFVQRASALLIVGFGIRVLATLAH